MSVINRGGTRHTGGESFFQLSRPVLRDQTFYRTGALIRALEGHTGSVKCLSFSHDGATIASGSADNTIRQWDATTGVVDPLTSPAPHTSPPYGPMLRKGIWLPRTGGAGHPY